MTKAELVIAVAKDARISRAAAAKAIDSITENIANELKRGGRISLTGFGTFSVTGRKARTGRSPRTGQTIRIPATRIARFRVGRAFRAQIGEEGLEEEAEEDNGSDYPGPMRE